MSRAATAAKGPKAPKAPKDAALRQFGALETGRLTWLGLSVALIGWTMLIAVAVLADNLRGPRSPAFHGDLMMIAQALIGSGFALAAIGTLQAGFGALDRFFGAVLHRSGGRVAGQAATMPAAADPEARDAFAGPAFTGPAFDRPAFDGPVYDAGPFVEAVPRQRRPYRTFPDGSVEVETILGTRRFATMGDAREFI